MSKDDLLFRNVLKIFGIVIGLVVGLPLIYLVVPGLVTSLLMLGGIVGFFWAVAKFVGAAQCNQDTEQDNDLIANSTYTRCPSGDVYAPGSKIKGMF